MLRRILVIAVAILALAAITVSVWQLQAGRYGLSVERIRVGETPATVMRREGLAGPLVVIAHGFAGSRQLMSAYQVTLARAGYVTLAYDLLGHGRNPVPMSGDTQAIDGTTQVLLEEMAAVVDAGLALPGVEGRAALVGHSMASDLVVRHAVDDPRVDAVVAISLYSEAVSDDAPQALLILNGAFEGRLRQPAQEMMAALGAEEGETVGTPGEGFARRAVAVPWAEHVGVLYAPTALEETRAWLDAVFGREDAAGAVGLPDGIYAPGGWIALLAVGVVALAWPLAQLLPPGPPPPPLGPWRFWTAALIPAVATPLILLPVETDVLPVLVADYLALHLAVYGALALVMLVALRAMRWRLAIPGAVGLAAWGLGAFGLSLDTYVGSFVPIPARWPIVAAILPGAVLAMTADAALAEAGRAPLARRLGTRAAFLASLLLAATLDIEALFFLFLIVPVILLYFLTYGTMGGFVGRRTGSTTAVGLGLGLCLAWALGVTFPLFAA